MYSVCEECGEIVEVDHVNNGVCMCYHYVHCGWGHVAPDDLVFNTIEELLEHERRS